jgi:hypothetical protein
VKEKALHMSLIQNFPDQLLDLHHHWHMPSAHPGSGPGRVHPAGTSGGGLEFLQFHRDYLIAFHAWYDTQAFANPPAVTPWHAIPPELKTPAAGWTAGWADAETRLTTNNPAFNSADELGTFLELGIHNMFLHGAAALVYNEPTLSTFHSPLSTYFYQLHGLVDWWWQQWETGHLPNAISHDLLRALGARLFGGVAVDGGGIAVAPRAPKPVDPWGPMSLKNVTRGRVEAIEVDMKRLRGR